MNKDAIILATLVTQLDDARLLHTRLQLMLTQSYTRQVLMEVAHLHLVIAGDLAERAHARGANPARTGSLLGRFRARHAGWLAVVNSNTELGCLLHAASCEARVLRHFTAVEDKLPGLQQRMHRHRRDLERVHAHIDLTIQHIRPRQWAG